MAMSKERNQAARELSEAIGPIAEQIVKEWDRTYIEIRLLGLEPRFDREIIKRIKAEPRIHGKFMEFMVLVVDDFGKVWYEFSEDQKEIITLKLSKIFL